MTTTTFTSGTVIESTWLNDVDNSIYQGKQDDGTRNAAVDLYLQSGTSAVERTVQAKLRETISVKDFGAVGDGTTNDTSAVQAALTAGAGNSVYIPAGTYMVSGLTVPANTLVYGVGTASVLKLRATGDVISTMGKHAVLQDFKIDGNGASFTGRGVVVDDGGTATVTNAWWRRFSNMEIVDTGSYCIEFTGASSGYLSEMIGGIYTRYNNTGASVKFPASETNGNRRMIGVMCFGNEIADLAGSDNTLVIGCEGLCPIYSSTTKKTRVIGNRLPLGSGLTLNGAQNVFAHNTIAETSITLGSSLSDSVVSDNSHATPVTVTTSYSTGANNTIRLPRVTYTPTWTGGSPTIGNGTLNGSYKRDGDECTVNIQLVIGSTTTVGSGAWSFSLPFAASARAQIGSAYIEDVSPAAVYSATTYIQASASTVRVAVAGSTAAYLGSATPITWATGDIVNLCFTYIVG